VAGPGGEQGREGRAGGIPDERVRAGVRGDSKPVADPPEHERAVTTEGGECFAQDTAVQTAGAGEAGERLDTSGRFTG
jgi:hypothetical protein